MSFRSTIGNSCAPSNFLFLASLFVLVLLTAAAAFAQQPIPAPIPNGLSNWYRAENNALDTQGGANGVVNNVGFGAGKVGSGFAFNGGGNVSLPASVGSFGTNDFSVDFWFNTTQVENLGNPIALLGNRVDCSDGNFFGVRMYSSNSLFVELDQDGGHTNYNAVQVSSGLNDGLWHHVAIVRQGTSLTVYLDGAAAGANTTAAVTNITGANPFLLGADGCGITQYVGALDELHIYNSPLTAAQVQSIHTAGVSGLTTLEGLWNFNEGTGTTTADFSGNGNTGTLSGTVLPTWTTDVPTGTTHPFSLSFDGNSSAVNVANGASASSLNFATQVTMAAWVKMAASTGPNGIFGIISKPSAAQTTGWRMAIGFNNALDFGLSNASSICAVDATQNALTPGLWTHVAATYDSSTATVQLFINGSSVPAITQGQACSGQLPISAIPLQIGEEYVGGGRNFNGEISEARVYNRILTGAEIAQLANPPASDITTCGTVITSPGAYVLFNDLTNCTGDGVDIHASNVLLKLAGHTISGQGQNAVGVLVGGLASGVSNVTVAGPGTVSNFGATGVGTAGASNSLITGLTITGNAQGVAVNQTFQAGNVRSTNNHFIKNNSLGNSFHGFTLNGGDQNIFTGNVSEKNGQSGFFLFDAHGNDVLNNIVSGNAGQGIIAQSSSGTGNLIQNNTALFNAADDLEDDNPNCANTWIANVFSTANQSCVGSRAVLTVTANSANITYGNPIPGLSYTITGFINGDTPAVLSGAPVLTTNATQSSGAGIYPIAISAGTLSGNYAFNFVPGTLVINLAPLTLVANNQVKFAGDPNPLLTYTAIGLVNGDTVATAFTGAPSLTTTATTSSGPGTYPITISQGALSAPNYVVTFVNGTLQVYRGPATITAPVTAYLYAGTPDSPQELTSYQINSQTGTLTQIPGATFFGADGTDALVADPLSRYLYVTTNSSPVNLLLFYQINQANGFLSGIGNVGSFITNSFHAAVDPTGRFLYVESTFTGNPQLLEFSINQQNGVPNLTTGIPIPMPNPSAIVIHPNGKFLYVVDSTVGSVTGYQIDPNSGILTQIPPALMPPTFPGSAAAIDPLGRFLYVAVAGTAIINGFSIDPNSGLLRPMSGGPVGSFVTQSMAIDPRGRFLFASGTNNSTAYNIDQNTGMLTFVPGATVPGGGQGAIVDPTGNFLYTGCACGGQNLAGFRIDQTSGALNPFGTFPFPGTNISTATALASYQSSTTVTSSLNPAIQGQPVMFTAHVTSSNAPVTFGTVTFSDFAAPVSGPVALDSNGNATFTTNTLAVGQHTINASYSGNASYATSSASLVQNITQTITAEPPITLPAGAQTTFTGGNHDGLTDTYITPYTASQDGWITSWQTEFHGQFVTGGPVVPAGVQLKVFRFTPNGFQVVAQGPVNDPRPLLQQRFGSSYPNFTDIASLTTFNDPPIPVKAGDYIGITIFADPQVGLYQYPMVGPAGTLRAPFNVVLNQTISPFNSQVSSIPQPPALAFTLSSAASDNPLNLQNNYFVTGDFASGGVTLFGTGSNGTATGTITIPSYNPNQPQGVPDGADIIAARLYWQVLESTPSPTGANATFRGYPIVGQKIGNDIAFSEGALSGMLRTYVADVNPYFPANAAGIRLASGSHTVTMPDSGPNSMPLAEGASLVAVYRVLSLSPLFPLKSVVIYEGSALVGNTPRVQVMQGFYDGIAQVKTADIFNSGGIWNNVVSSEPLESASQFDAVLNAGAHSAVVLSTPVNNTDNDGILNAWKAGPAAPDFHAGQPGYYDVKDGSWVPLPGAALGQKDLFVQLDYECAAVFVNTGTCDPAQENLFPSPDSNGNDPLLMVQQAFASHGVALHLTIGNAVPEDTCTDNLSANPPQLCQFSPIPDPITGVPKPPTGVVGWKNSLLFSKVWPKNFLSCLQGGDCSPRFPHGQKDSYHYVLFGHALAVPQWTSRFGTLTSLVVQNGVTTIGTTDRGTGLQKCPGRITISGVLTNPSLNGVYNVQSCSGSTGMTIKTPGVPNWSLAASPQPEPLIGITSGNISSISGYSDLGGADSAVTLGLWLTSPNQDMSKKANVIAGTLFHEIGHTLGLTHGGLYYDTPGSFMPTFEANCKPNYQSDMNYLFQLDGIGLTHALDYSSQMLNTINESGAGSITQLVDSASNPATYPTSAWYSPIVQGVTASPATRHCDGTPLNGESFYRVDASISPIAPAWQNGQDINFDGVPNESMRGYNDWANIDLRQVGATGGQFDSLSGILSFGGGSAPVNVGAGGNVTLGSGGTVTLGSGGNVTLGSGGNVTLGSGGTISLGSGGNVTLGSGGTVTLGSGGTVTPGSDGNVTLGSGGAVILSSGGTITLGSGGVVTLGFGGTITLGSGGTVVPNGGDPVTIGVGGQFTLGAGGGTVTLGSGGNVTLGSGGNVTLGSGGTITLGSGGNVTLGSGGNVTLGSGGNIALGSGGNVTLGSGGNVTLGSGGTITLGSGGTITLGSGGNVILGSGGTVTLGSAGNVALGSGGNVTLGSGGTVTLGSGGTVTLGSGGNVTLGSGGTITLGSGGTVTLGSGGNVTLGSGGTITLGSGGIITLGSGGTITLGSGGTVTPNGGAPSVIGSGGSFTFGASGGTVTLGSGGNVTLGSGGNVTLGSGGTITLGSGGNVTLGSGGNVTLGSGGTITLGSGGTVTLGSGGNVTLGSGGVVALGSGGNITLGSGGTIALGSGGNVTLGSGGVQAVELTYDDANSVVRAPELPTVTPTALGQRVNWTPPAFGVVNTYTIFRADNGGNPVPIGSVTGNPPVTTFTDPNPNLVGTSVYTISTTVVPDVQNPQPRLSPPSPPAVVKNDQTIAFAPLPNVQLVDSPITVSAAANSGLQVNFAASGNCNLMSGTTTMTGGVSSASLSLSASGNCTVTASQPGNATFNPAAPVAQGFSIAGGNAQSSNQTISFAPLSSHTFGDADFMVSASASSSLPVMFTAGGNCTLTGANTVHITGAGACEVTASQNGNASFNSAVPVTQSFNIGKANATIMVTSYNVAYDGKPHTATGTATGVGGANLMSSLALSPTTHTLAGAYHDTWVFEDLSGNYNNTSGMVTDIISQANATVSANPAGKTYGDSDPPLTATASGFTAADAATLTLSATRAPGEGAGTYTITPAASGAVLANYTVTYKTAAFTISKAVLTVSADNKTKILDTANPTFTATYSGFKKGEMFATSGVTGNPSLTTTATTTSPVGTYTITAAAGSLTANNYTFAFANGKLTILYATGANCDGAPGHTILPPVASDGTSVFKQGRTVPVQFRVCDASGVSIGTPGVVTSFLLTGIYNGTLANEDQTVYATNNDTAFRWDSSGQQWIFNLSTSNLTAGQTYIYTITLNDGTIVSGSTFAPTGTASFQFGMR